MWKIICALLLFQKASSAPSGCMEICSPQNSQYFRNQNCCASPIVSSPTDNKNWTDHKDFQTNDGALVHTKDGKFVNGNTRGSFNEMSYYKEFNSGGNQNFENNFKSNQHPGGNYGISQKLEDLSTSSHSTFETMFQSQFSELIKNFHDSFNHLQELKRKDQLPIQDCVYPCVPVNQQISRLQQDLTSQQQYMQRMREDLWTRMQNHNTITETEPVIPVQTSSPSTYYPGQTIKEINRHESYHNEKITTHPHITTTITNQPNKYVSSPQQSHGAGSTHQDYYTGSGGQYGSSQYTQNYGSGTHGQTDYNQQNSGYSPQITGSQIQSGRDQQNSDSSQYRQNYGSGIQSQPGYTQENSGYVAQITGSQIQSGRDQRVSSSSQYQQKYAPGIQNQPGYTQDNTGYGSQIKGSQIQSGYDHQSNAATSQYRQNYGTGIQSQAGYTQDNSGYGSQIEGSQVKGGHDQQRASHGSQSYYSRQTQGGYGQQNSAYKNQQSGAQTDATQTQDGYIIPHGTVTVSHDSMSRSSVTHNYGAGFGSRDGKLTHGLIQMGSTDDCNDGTQPLSYKRYKRHIHHPHQKNHHHHHHQHEEDFSQQQVQQPFQDNFQQSNQHVEDFGEPAKIQKVSQQEIQDLSQQVEDIRHGKLETQDMYQQHQDFTQQTQKLPPQSQDFSQQSQFGNEYSQQSAGVDDFSQNTGNLEFGKQNNHHSSQIPNLPEHIQGFNQKQYHGFNDYSQQFGKQSDYPSQHFQDFSQQQDQNLDDSSQQSERFRFGQHHYNHGLGHHSGNLELGQQHQQFPSQIESQSQQTEGFDSISKTEKLEDKQSQKISDLSNQPNGLNQQTVGHLRLNQHARDSFNFNQFPTPVLAPDSNQAGNQRHDGLDTKYNLPRMPAPKPTSRPRNSKPNQLNIDKNTNAERIFNPDQGIQSSFEKIKNTGRGDISAENGQTPIDQALTPPEVPDTQVGYQESSKEIYKNDFGQQEVMSGEEFPQQLRKSFINFPYQVQKPGEGYSQHVQKPFDDLSQQVIKPREIPFEDFSQQVQKPSEGFSLHVQKPFEDFSQQVQKSQKDSFQKIESPFEDFSQQVLKPREEPFQQLEIPFEDFSQQVQKPSEGFSLHVQKPFEDFSQQVLKPREEPFQQLEIPFEDFSQQVQKPSEGFSLHVQKPFEDFSQQVLKPREESFQKVEGSFENLSQQVQKPSEGFLHHVQKPFEDFPKQVQKPKEDSSQKIESPFENLSQQTQAFHDDISQKDLKITNNHNIQKAQEESFQKVQNPFEDFSGQAEISRESLSQHPQKPFDDFSQQIQKSLQDSFQKGQKPFEDLSQQIQTPDEVFSQTVMKPFDKFSQQGQIYRKDSLQKVQKPFENDFQELDKSNNDMSQQIEKSFEHVSQHVQRLYKDLSQTSDLSRNKDVTQLPQSFQDQDKNIDYSNSDIFQQSQDISLGHQWHLSHNPGDLTNEDLHLGRLSGSVQQAQKEDETQQIVEIQKIKETSNKKEKELKFDQQSTQEQLEPWQEEMSRETEVIRGTSGKLEFGQSVQNQRNDPQIQSGITLISLQPRILQAFGGKGPYDPMHSEDIFSDVRQNPSATLPPVILDDPWDIHEKPMEFFDTINDDKVIPLDTPWVYPDAFPISPVTEKPNPGFWNRVGRKFSNAVDKAKEKARDIFG